MTSQENTGVATLMILSERSASEKVKHALCAAATALGHAAAPFFCVVSNASPRELGLLVHETDPWCVVAIDNTSANALRLAFAGELQDLEPDHPSSARGYQFVFVPDFEDCLDDMAKKRISWERLKAARYPGAPF